MKLHVTLTAEEATCGSRSVTFSKALAQASARIKGVRDIPEGWTLQLTDDRDTPIGSMTLTETDR
jgi:hypothetical protein